MSQLISSAQIYANINACASMCFHKNEKYYLQRKLKKNKAFNSHPKFQKFSEHRTCA